MNLRNKMLWAGCLGWKAGKTADKTANAN
jgi:hypothetical protein